MTDDPRWRAALLRARIEGGVYPSRCQVCHSPIPALAGGLYEPLPCQMCGETLEPAHGAEALEALNLTLDDRGTCTYDKCSHIRVDLINEVITVGDEEMPIECWGAELRSLIN